MRQIPIGSLFANRVNSIDPRSYPNESFELWSIPASDKGEPDIEVGSLIGSTKKCVEPNDVLLSRIVPHIRRATVVTENRGKRQIASSEWIIFRSPDFWPAYLKHLLVSDRFHDQFMNTTAGVGGSLVRARPEAVAKISIPLPALDEQRRIAAILDQADDLRRKRRLTIRKLNSLPQAIFHAMFGDPSANDGRFPVKFLSELTTKIGSGATPKGGNSSYQTEGVTLIRSMNVRDGYFSYDGLAFLSKQQAAKLDLVIVEENDVLINITGASVARVCKAPSSILPARVNQHVSIIRPNEELTAEFLEAFLLSPTIQTRLRMISESGATRQAITKGALERLQIPVPPASMQRDFASRTVDVFRLQAKAAESSSGLEALLASLQNFAFGDEFVAPKAITALAV